MTAAAREVRRMAYLEAMGVDCYVSRGQLPGAAATARLALLQPAPATDSAAAAQTPVVGKSAGTPVAPELPHIDTAPRPAPARPAPSPAPVTVDIPAFSMAAIAAGGLLWLEELEQSALATDQVQLVQAMAHALGLPRAKAEVGQFNWPIHNNTQFDLGEEAARAGLLGFIRRRTEQLQCRGLVLLGEACARRLGELELGELRCWRTLSSAAMIAEPGLKRQAWRDLLALARET